MYSEQIQCHTRSILDPIKCCCCVLYCMITTTTITTTITTNTTTPITTTTTNIPLSLGLLLQIQLYVVYRIIYI